MSLLKFLAPIVSRRELILSLTKRDLAGRYAGSILGVLWTVIHPVVMIAIYWFVFGIGFRAQPMMNMPFVIWLTAGMLPWLLFTEIIQNSSASVVENAGLIKKTVFPSQVLAVSKVCSALVSHLVLVGLLLVLMWTHGVAIPLLSLQALYYLFGTVIIALGLGWFVSALNVFVRDVGQITGVVIQVWFWMTAVFWDLKIMPIKVQQYLELNPMLYVVQGYRDSFLYAIPITHDLSKALLFWGCASFALLLGILVFRRLQPHFGDVL